MFRGFYGLPNEGSRKVFSMLLETLKKWFSKVYAFDNLIALNRNLAFLEDEKFSLSFNKNAVHPQEKTLAWRLHTLVWAANQCLNVQGDFVECGVFRGFCSAVISDYLEFENMEKQYFLYDTFTGIPEEMNSEGFPNDGYVSVLKGEKDSVYNQVKDRFSKYENIHVVRGIVPASFKIQCPEKISFLHLDLNSSMAEIAALDVLFEKISPGGIVVFDDYGQLAHREQCLAENAYFNKLGYKILEIPTGQGLLIKR